MLHESLEAVYYTGDFATVISGEYYFEGRRDAQVKINGNRVSLSEVEFAMLEIGCREVAAIFYADHIFCFYCGEEQQVIKEHFKKYCPRMRFLLNLPIWMVYPTAQMERLTEIR